MGYFFFPGGGGGGTGGGGGGGHGEGAENCSAYTLLTTHCCEAREGKGDGQSSVLACHNNIFALEQHTSEHALEASNYTLPADLLKDNCLSLYVPR